MFRRILIPLAGAAADAAREERAIEAARQLAEREGARLVLLHVDHPDAAQGADADLGTHAAIINRAAELRHAGVEVSAHFATGVTDERIADTAREEHADLIVIAPHQRPLLRALLQPGVVGHLMRRAPAPLLVWPERPSATPEGTEGDIAQYAALALGAENAAPVIVPLDGSREAARALPLAADFARTHQRTLLLVTVTAALPFVGLEMAYPGIAFPSEAELPEDRLRASLSYLGRVRRELRARCPELVVQTMGRIGETAPVLADLAAAHPGSIVVMTTHGRGRALQLLLGSVATELLSLTPAPLMILPHQRRSPRWQTTAHAVAVAVGAQDAEHGVDDVALSRVNAGVDAADERAPAPALDELGSWPTF